MDDVLDSANMADAWNRVRSNKGAAGPDGHTIEETGRLLKTSWPEIKDSLQSGSYQPGPVRTVHIPKGDGKSRMLGIPNVVDRLIQQAIHQVLSPHYEKDFSASSYGFRPGRNAWQAIGQAHDYVKRGYNTVVDIDLEKFFDQVNHDILMAKLARRIQDKRLLGLIRRYLQSGMMMDGLVSQREKGTPQGSPLSPLLSNILLDELDKELEARGHRFCRYADDCQVYVKSLRAGHRVKESMTAFLETRLKLPVNRSKSRVVAASRSSFLGYGFLGMANPRIRCSTETVKRFKRRVRQLTRGHDREAIEVKLARLDRYIRGWASYFRLAKTHRLFADLDGWIRSRLRMCLMKQWFKPRTRVRKMIELGLPVDEARGYSQHKRWWFLAQLHHTRFLMNNHWWRDRGFRGVSFYVKRFANT
ncbi:group II intron reverse transcriptase/maturase [Ectothiorhodospira lacustris]|uniref:group II intron reverse transcriptase/maturase n=1 Tax=Ectothiorhodospira lacustris TaxID=2899127 RepID=UPI001EE9ABE1|nr:group II intron reverse transcriptase/maturase [Ectothiorhodospira lacustris]MCG5501969.1 group II intron reverse transcriptase/maturase [Ectothiorhodospira lacustris]